MELANEQMATPLLLAATETSTAMASELLRLGANVNHQRDDGHTALTLATRGLQVDMVKLLTSYCNSLNISVDDKDRYCQISPLHMAYNLYIEEYLDVCTYVRLTSDTINFADIFDIIKCIVPLCSSFDDVVPSWTSSSDGNIQPTVVTPFAVMFFSVEANHCRTPPAEYGEFPVTTLLLRHGAAADFWMFYEVLCNCYKHVGRPFLRLARLAGSRFDTYFAQLLKIRTLPAMGQAFVQETQYEIDELFSQPLRLQELSVMAIRQCIGSRQLWKKIDSLPVPPVIKDAIKLIVESSTR